MSVVDNFILVTDDDLLDDPGVGPFDYGLNALNTRLKTEFAHSVGDGFQPLLRAGGPKVMEANVYGLATNFLDVEAFVSAVERFFLLRARTCDWNAAQLFMLRDAWECRLFRVAWQTPTPRDP